MCAPTRADIRQGYYQAPAKDVRGHVEIDPNTKAAVEHHLFQSTGLDLQLQDSPEAMAIAFQAQALDRSAFDIKSPDCNTLPAHLVHRFGGEGRLASWQQQATHGWECPDALKTALAASKCIRLVLATPAYSENGSTLDNSVLPPALAGATCVASIVSTWAAVSGWAFRDKVGPKPLRRLIPAGSVFFYQLTEAPINLHAHWLQPLGSTEPQCNHDGFGLALWGIW